jgi:ADP-ribose pyrophosphatase YjhB (NUDIX family)
LSQKEIFGKVRRFCEGCAYIHFANPKVAAVVFIEQDHQVLLVQRAMPPEVGKWGLPAGYIDLGEDPQAAAIRETLEETGLTVKITRLLDVMFNTGQTPPVIIIIYAAQIVAGQLLPADDASDARWFNAADLPDLAFESTRLILTRWQNQTL